MLTQETNKEYILNSKTDHVTRLKYSYPFLAFDPLPLVQKYIKVCRSKVWSYLNVD